MFKNLLKSLLLIVAVTMGALNANAAGYTRTLNDALTVTGYQSKAFYNFQNNTLDMFSACALVTIFVDTHNLNNHTHNKRENTINKY